MIAPRGRSPQGEPPPEARNRSGDRLVTVSRSASCRRQVVIAARRRRSAATGRARGGARAARRRGEGGGVGDGESARSGDALGSGAGAASSPAPAAPRRGLVARLVRELDTLPAISPGPPIPCSSDDASQIVALLGYPNGRRVTIAIGLTGCTFVTNGSVSRLASRQLLAGLERLTGSVRLSSWLPAALGAPPPARTDRAGGTGELEPTEPTAAARQTNRCRFVSGSGWRAACVRRGRSAWRA
jgi:hypothetical protein